MGPGVIRAEEAVENLFMRVLRNADPVVAYSEARRGTLPSSRFRPCREDANI